MRLKLQALFESHFGAKQLPRKKKFARIMHWKKNNHYIRSG